MCLTVYIYNSTARVKSFLLFITFLKVFLATYTQNPNLFRTHTLFCVCIPSATRWVFTPRVHPSLCLFTLARFFFSFLHFNLLLSILSNAGRRLSFIHLKFVHKSCQIPCHSFKQGSYTHSAVRISIVSFSLPSSLLLLLLCMTLKKEREELRVTWRLSDGQRYAYILGCVWLTILLLYISSSYHSLDLMMAVWMCAIPVALKITVKDQTVWMVKASFARRGCI